MARKPGPPPTPTALRLLNGNPGKRAMNHNEPKLPPAVPDPPAHLSKIARDEWRRLVVVLQGAGMLTNADRTCLAMYCQVYGRWVTAERKVSRQGTVVKTKTGYPIQNPQLAVATRAFEQLRSLMGELGLSPASRSRINADGPPPGANPDEDRFFAPPRNRK